MLPGFTLEWMYSWSKRPLQCPHYTCPMASLRQEPSRSLAGG